MLQDFKNYVRFLATCCLVHPQDFNYENIEEVIKWEESVPDEATGYALFRMSDGTWGTLEESQDYSGHG